MEARKPNILIVDDQEDMARCVARGISHRTDKYQLHYAHNLRDALLQAKRIKPEVVVLDLCIEEEKPESGLSLIPKFFEIDDTIKIIVLTGITTEEWGIKCVDAGAVNFLAKPANPDELFTLIANSIKSSRLLRSSRKSSDSARQVFAELGLATKSAAMKAVLDDIALAAITDQPVLLSGETGVGKTYIAQLLHHGGLRENGRFIRSQPVSGCHDLVMSELFGHTKGSFTGATGPRTGLIELADGGTLFLDEIDHYSPEVEVALLHVLQTKEYSAVGSNTKKVSDFRLISATNYPDDHIVSDGQMREDFYHRIAKIKIRIPPLRERREDIPDISRSILERLMRKEECKVIDFSREALYWLCIQPWKGNIRELESVIELGFLHTKRAGKSQIRVSDLSRSSSTKIEQIDGTLTEQLRAIELNIASVEFIKNSENHSATARSLGIDRKRLRKILSRSGVVQ